MAKSQGLKKNLCAALVLGALAASAATAAPVVSFSASPTTTTAGGTLALSVLITGVTDLYSYNYTINFNPAVVQFTSATEGSFLGTGGDTFYIAGTVDNTAGTYTFSGDSLVGASHGVSGSGVLERLTFAVSATAPATFGFAAADTGFYDTNFNAIAASTSSLTVAAAVPEPATYALFGLGVAGLVAWRRRSAPANRTGAIA